jgi:serine/threonine protein kinase
MVSGQQLASGDVVQGRYEVQKLLAKGGMSWVYLVRDRNVAGRPCVLKQLDAQFSSPEDINNFQQEAKILSDLDHPNIVKIYDFSQGRESYIVMEYVDGQTLQSIWEQTPDKQLDERKVLEWGAAICEVFSYLHNKKPNPIIFRDFKPANVMLNSRGELKFIDFGIARFFKALALKSGDTARLGTEGYAPPELYSGSNTGQSTPSTDVYTLGASLHQLLTGRDPAKEPPFQFPLVTRLNNKISSHGEQIVMRALQLDRPKRYQTAEDMQHDLQLVLHGGVLTPARGPDINNILDTPDKVVVLSKAVVKTSIIPRLKYQLPRPAYIQSESKVEGNVFAAKVYVGDGAHIKGNVFGRDEVHLEDNARIDGIVITRSNLLTRLGIVVKGLSVKQASFQGAPIVEGSFICLADLVIPSGSVVKNFIWCLGSVTIEDSCEVSGVLACKAVKVGSDCSVGVIYAQKNIWAAPNLTFQLIRCLGSVTLGDRARGHTLLAKGDVQLGEASRGEFIQTEGSLRLGSSNIFTAVAGRNLLVGAGSQLQYATAYEQLELGDEASVKVANAGRKCTVGKRVRVEDWSLVTKEGSIVFADSMRLKGYQVSRDNLFYCSTSGKLQPAASNVQRGKIQGAILTTLIDKSLYETIAQTAGLSLSI